MKRSLCLYFRIHHPFQLKTNKLKDVDLYHSYEDADADEFTINQFADNCYLPVNEIMLANIRNSNGQFKASYSISGVLLELLWKHRADVIESIKDLVDTGSVEILAETYYNSLSSLHSTTEFARQVEKHSAIVRDLFGVETRIFRNTELIYDNRIAGQIRQLGFKGIICEGVKRLLNGRSPNRIYSVADTADFPLLLRNARLSNDIALRFDDGSWNQAGKFAQLLNAYPGEDEVINLFLDYETFGIYKKESSIINEFLRNLPGEILALNNLEFSTPSNVVERVYPHDVYDVPKTISWNDQPEACCVWSENARQNNTLKKIYSLEQLVMRSENKQLIELWGRLQTADYFFYMSDANCPSNKHLHISHSAEQVFEYYTNILTDLEIKLIKEQLKMRKQHFIPQTNNFY